MTEESKPLICLRCGSIMDLDRKAYTIPAAKSRGNPYGDNNVINLEDGRLVRLFLCSNQECLTIEVKAANEWPVGAPAPR